MKSRPKSRLAISCVAFLAAVGSWVGPARVARAAAEDVDTKFDARLECFPTDSNAINKDAGTPGSWLILVMISIVGLGGMFMNAKRANLD